MKTDKENFLDGLKLFESGLNKFTESITQKTIETREKEIFQNLNNSVLKMKNSLNDSSIEFLYRYFKDIYEFDYKLELLNNEKLEKYEDFNTFSENCEDFLKKYVTMSFNYGIYNILSKVYCGIWTEPISYSFRTDKFLAFSPDLSKFNFHIINAYDLTIIDEYRNNFSCCPDFNEDIIMYLKKMILLIKDENIIANDCLYFILINYCKVLIQFNSCLSLKNIISSAIIPNK